MICFAKITDIFSIVDEFCKDFDKTTQPFLLGKPSKRSSIMSKSEVITIYLLFHLSGFRCFKHYYIFYVQKKRSIIETVNDELKNICQVEHSRHRSFTNFLTNLIAGIIAHNFLLKKLSLKYETVKTNQLAVFY
jgi:hypothetical protein